jgi:hypothetical protein
MTFNIREFKANIQKGLLSPNTYRVLMTPPSIVDRKTYSLLTDSVSIPSLGFFNSDNIRPYGFGPTYTLPYGLNVTEITCTHYVDSKSNMHKMFEEWMSSIVNWKTAGSYSAQYLKDYSTDIEIETYDKSGKLSASYSLREAFPINMDQIGLNWMSTDELTKFGVTYKFTDWRINK